MIVYFYAACVLSTIGSFVARNVKFKLEQRGPVDGAVLTAVLILDAIDLALFSFAFVKLLDYVKGAA